VIRLDALALACRLRNVLRPFGGTAWACSTITAAAREIAAATGLRCPV